MKNRRRKQEQQYQKQQTIKTTKSQPPELPAHASLEPRVPAEPLIASKQVPVNHILIFTLK